MKDVVALIYELERRDGGDGRDDLRDEDNSRMMKVGLVVGDEGDSLSLLLTTPQLLAELGLPAR